MTSLPIPKSFSSALIPFRQAEQSNRRKRGNHLQICRISILFQKILCYLPLQDILNTVRANPYNDVIPEFNWVLNTELADQYIFNTLVSMPSLGFEPLSEEFLNEMAQPELGTDRTLLLKHVLCPTLTQDSDLFDDFMAAGSRGDLTVVKGFLQDPRFSTSIPQGGLDLLISRAAKDGQIDIVRFLLATTLPDGFTVSQDGLYKAILRAIEHGQIDIVKLLLTAATPNGSTLRPDSLKALILSAILAGHTEIVRLLFATTLPDGSTVSQEDLDRGMYLAMMDEHIDIVRLLLATTLPDGSTVSQNTLNIIYAGTRIRSGELRNLLSQHTTSFYRFIGTMNNFTRTVLTVVENHPGAALCAAAAIGTFYCHRYYTQLNPTDEIAAN